MKLVAVLCGTTAEVHTVNLHQEVAVVDGANQFIESHRISVGLKLALLLFGELHGGRTIGLSHSCITEKSSAHGTKHKYQYCKSFHNKKGFKS